VFILLPVLTIAENPDPIIGSWYMMINIKGSPLEATAPDYTRTIIILTLEESGNVILSEIDFKGEKVETNTPMVCGEWKKNGSEYSISIISTGKVRAFINKELLHIDLYNSGIYFGLRKMEPLDLYTDISR
jgi:hypothetical protein